MSCVNAYSSLCAYLLYLSFSSIYNRKPQEIDSNPIFSLYSTVIDQFLTVLYDLWFYCTNDPHFLSNCAHISFVSVRKREREGGREEEREREREEKRK